MTALLIALACATACFALFKGAFYFMIDAAPVGSMMLAASGVLLLVSAFSLGYAAAVLT
jgi:hypothetical protein